MPSVLLYFDYGADSKFHRARLDGIRRYARTRGWSVVALPPEESGPGAVRALIARHAPVGCIVERSRLDSRIPASAFGDVPFVLADPPEPSEQRGAAHVTCDNAAVARAAFRELSANLPPFYAVVPYVHPRGWSRERVAMFRSLCRAAGRDCAVFRMVEGEDRDARFARLADWAAALPLHCAIFGVNDYVAWLAATALRSRGRNVPRSATVIGVDGFDRLPDGADSWISSIKLDYERTGFLAARLLDEEISRKAHGVRRNQGGPVVFGPLLTLRRESTRGSGRRDNRVIDAVAMIRREACDGLTAAALASRFPCSRNLFERRFREAMGRSVLDEIINVRMETARSLLARRDFPIGAVAAFCGFRSDRALQKLFKERTGLSLRDWRKANLL